MVTIAVKASSMVGANASTALKRVVPSASLTGPVDFENDSSVNSTNSNFEISLTVTSDVAVIREVTRVVAAVWIF